MSNQPEADDFKDQMWSVSNYMAFVMGACHQHIVDRTFIEQLTPHQYTTKKVEALIQHHQLQLIDRLMKSAHPSKVVYDEKQSKWAHVIPLTVLEAEKARLVGENDERS